MVGRSLAFELMALSNEQNSIVERFHVFFLMFEGTEAAKLVFENEA